MCKWYTQRSAEWVIKNIFQGCKEQIFRKYFNIFLSVENLKRYTDSFFCLRPEYFNCNNYITYLDLAILTLVRVWVHTYLCVCLTVWPDLAKIRHFGKMFKFFANVLRVDVVLGQILRYFLYAFEQFFCSIWPFIE